MTTSAAQRLLTMQATLSHERNRWFFISLLAMLIALMSLISAHIAYNRATHNLQIAWVKMQPHGTWDVDFHQTAECAKEYFPATINFMIKQFVEQRYSLSRTSIQSDFGAAQLLMAKPLAQAFLSPHDFDAVGLAQKYQGCQDCEDMITMVRNISHYDSDVAQFGPYRGTLYRTNVFIVQMKRDTTGAVITKTNKIVALQWRLKDLTEIKMTPEILKYNPIGMEILKTELLDEPVT